MRKISSFLLFFIFLFLILAKIVSANPIKELFEQGLVLYSQGEYAQAIESFENVLTYYPQLAAAYNYIGLSQKALNLEKEKVLASFEKAIEVDPKYFPAYDSLSKYYYSLGQFDRAEEYGLKAVSFSQNQTTSYLTLGWIALVGQGDPQKAISYFEKTLGQADFFYTYFGLGIAYYMDGQSPKVLDMITLLRDKNEEGLALKLEALLRSGTHNTSQYNDFLEMMLRPDAFPQGEPSDRALLAPASVNLDNPSSVTGTQRILDLQKRGADFSNSDLYY